MAAAARRSRRRARRAGRASCGMVVPLAPSDRSLAGGRRSMRGGLRVALFGCCVALGQDQFIYIGVDYIAWSWRGSILFTSSIHRGLFNLDTNNNHRNLVCAYTRYSYQTSSRKKKKPYGPPGLFRYQ